MRACLVSLLTLAPLLGLARAAHAHIGDEVYLFYELLDEDLHRIDLTDGSVEDWHDVLGDVADSRRLLLPGLPLRSRQRGQPLLARLAPAKRDPLGRHGALR